MPRNAEPWFSESVERALETHVAHGCIYEWSYDNTRLGRCYNVNLFGVGWWHGNADEAHALAIGLAAADQRNFRETQSLERILELGPAEEKS